MAECCIYLCMYMKTELSSIVKIILSQLTYICAEQKSSSFPGPASLRFTRFSLREKLCEL